MKTKTIAWIMDGTMPDDLVSVLICDSCGEVGEGFHDEGWRWACAALIDGPLRAWAHLPEGPEPSEEGGRP